MFDLLNEILVTQILVYVWAATAHDELIAFSFVLDAMFEKEDKLDRDIDEFLKIWTGV